MSRKGWSLSASVGDYASLEAAVQRVEGLSEAWSGVSHDLYDFLDLFRVLCAVLGQGLACEVAENGGVDAGVVSRVPRRVCPVEGAYGLEVDYGAPHTRG